MDWIYCQNNSDKILCEGLSCLKKSTSSNWQEVSSTMFGNYLISNSQKAYYIGQSKKILRRLWQHLGNTNSKFYREFKKKCKSELAILNNLELNYFKVRTLETKIGRRELEEFGIVNLPTILNISHKNKRTPVFEETHTDIWGKVQGKHKDLLSQGEKLFFKQKLFNWDEVELSAAPSVYRVFDKSGQLIYLGETVNIEKRHLAHSRRSYISALRRNVGTDIFKFDFVGKKKFCPRHDEAITQFLQSCSIAYMKVSFGRLELEEYLIKKYKSVLNRKDNT